MNIFQNNKEPINDIKNELALDSFKKKLNVIESLDDETWQEIRTRTSIMRYEANYELFPCNQIQQTIYFCIDGLARLHYSDSEGLERNKSIIKSGDTIASLESFVDGKVSPVGAKAITRCIFAVMTFDEYFKLIKESEVCARLCRKMMEQTIIQQGNREHSLLMLNATERYQQFLLEYGQYQEDIGLNNVAMYLGITNVSLSRIRKKLGII